MQADTEQSVREAAYFLWERDGRPEGLALEHWTAAQRIVANQERGDLTADEEAVVEGDPEADYPAVLTKDVPGEMTTTVTLKAVSVGTEVSIEQQGIPDVIPHSAATPAAPHQVAKAAQSALLSRVVSAAGGACAGSRGWTMRLKP